jgi:hypothetical protein
MSSAIIDGTNIDTTVFSYSAPKANPSGGKVVNLYNKNFRESLTLSTPLILTWGAQEGMDQAKNPTGKFTMSLQFPNKDFPNADCESFLTSMRALESKIKADALTYSKEWFGKEIKSSDVMDEKFNVMLRHPKKEKGSAELDYNKPPTLTVKIPCWKGVWQSEIYDEEGTPLFLKGKSPSHVTPLDFLKPKTHVICLLQCGGLWFVNGKVSITWNLKQAIVQKPRTSAIAEGTCFLKPKAADVEKLKTLPPPEEDIDPEGGGVSSTIVDDSDDDEFELPPPPVKVVEKVVVVEKVIAVAETVVEKVIAVAETVVETPVVAVAAASEEPKKKKVITKKKVDA